MAERKATTKRKAAPKAAPKEETCPKHPEQWQQAAARRRSLTFPPHPECTCVGGPT